MQPSGPAQLRFRQYAVWAACTADVSLRVVDLTVDFENHSKIVKHADAEIKKLIANTWIRKSDNIKFKPCSAPVSVSKLS
jgi:hypothetical protein